MKNLGWFLALILYLALGIEKAKAAEVWAVATVRSYHMTEKDGCWQQDVTAIPRHILDRLTLRAYQDTRRKYFFTRKLRPLLPSQGFPGVAKLRQFTSNV